MGGKAAHYKNVSQGLMLMKWKIHPCYKLLVAAVDLKVSDKPRRSPVRCWSTEAMGPTSGGRFFLFVSNVSRVKTCANTLLGHYPLSITDNIFRARKTLALLNLFVFHRSFLKVSTLYQGCSLNLMYLSYRILFIKFYLLSRETDMNTMFEKMSIDVRKKNASPEVEAQWVGEM